MFARPKTVDEALTLLAQGTGAVDWVVLSGGTDFYPALQDKPITQPVMDISAVQGWREITPCESGWRIGALSTWTDLIRCALPESFDALKLAAREVGSVQIQNRGTIVGNLCNASPAADGVPPLLILDAQIELISARGTRMVPLSEFIQGNRQTQRETDELVSAIVLPHSSCSGSSDFIKLGSRRYLVISIAMVAARVQLDDAGCVQQAAVAVGACSAVAQRLHDYEDKLTGRHVEQALPVVDANDMASLTPINDIRASASYRLDVVPELVHRAMEKTIQHQLSISQ